MILNRVNYENDEEDIKENDNEKKENKKIKKKKEKKKEEVEEEENEEEEEEEEEEEDGEEEEEKDDEKYGDSHRRKMLRSSGSDEENIGKFKSKKSCCKICSVILIISLIFLVIIIIIATKKGKNKIAGFFSKDTNITQTEELNIPKDRLNIITNELINTYSNGEINVIKFFEEFVTQKSYTPPDYNQFKNVHIAVGFTENEIDNTIKHIASAIHHSASTTFLHIHMLNIGTLSFENLLKLKNVIYKINNNTEIIVYNAEQAKEKFSIREGSISKFSKDYAKLYAFKLVRDIPTLIFLDADDCMVQKDLAELYSLDLKDIYGRGLPEIPSIKHPMEWMDNYLPDRSHYINGGVVLVNFDLCKKEDFYHKAKDINNNDFYTKTEEPFQDIINILMRKKIEFFHPRYNKISFYEANEDRSNEGKWYPWVVETLKQGEKNNHFYSREELLEADNDPVIIHYAWEKQLNKTVKKYEDDLLNYAKLAGLCQ